MRYLLILVFLLVCAGPALAATQDATVSWTASNPAATGYAVERAGALAGPYSQVGTTNATTLTFVDANLAQGSTFCYRIIGLGAVANSAPSPGTCANTAGTPGVPGQPTVTITIKP